MRRLEKRLNRLEQQASFGLNESVDDQEILAVLAGDQRSPEVQLAAIGTLFEISFPAMHLSLIMGGLSHAYCRRRGIDRPSPIGPLDLLAAIEAQRNSSAPPPEVIEAWNRVVAGAESLDSQLHGGQPLLDPAEAIRSILVVMMTRHMGVGIVGPGWPVLDEAAGSRLRLLAAPMEAISVPDLPLLAWYDTEGQHQDSWPGDPLEVRLPIDVGLKMPGYIWSAPTELTQTHAVSPDRLGRPLRKQRVPAVAPRSFSDEQLVSRLASGPRPFVRGIPEELDAIYLHIEPFLRASVLLGARSLRINRSRGDTQPIPQTAVDQAATILSYPNVVDMPADVLHMCGWAIPSAEQYDAIEPGLGIASFTVGSVRGALVLRLLEKEGIESLRKVEFSSWDVPTPTAEEISRCLSLVEPLQWDPDPDLPLLSWRGSDSKIWSSWTDQTGQMRSYSDIDLQERPELFLADPSVVRYPDPEDFFDLDHYRPGSSGKDPAVPRV